MGVRGFERRLEQLVEGSFGKAFRSGLQPVEVARKLVRTLDDSRTIGVRGTVVANRFIIALSSDDAERFDDYADVLERELGEEVRSHARSERYHFLGPVSIQLVEDPRLKVGDLDIEAKIAESPGGRVGALVLADGRRLVMSDTSIVIGRLPDCEVPVDDPRASRRHAEIRPEPEGFLLVDLGSLNGTTVNGTPVKEHLLEDGDIIAVGSATMRFEAS